MWELKSIRDIIWLRVMSYIFAIMWKFTSKSHVHVETCNYEPKMYVCVSFKQIRSKGLISVWSQVEGYDNSHHGSCQCTPKYLLDSIVLQKHGTRKFMFMPHIRKMSASSSSKSWDKYLNKGQWVFKLIKEGRSKLWLVFEIYGEEKRSHM